MPSFDIVSKIDSHELDNAIDQANREILTRFDLKNTNAKIHMDKTTITLTAPTDFQLKQIDEILRNKLAKRQVDYRAFQYEKPESNLKETKQIIQVQQGISTENAKKIVKLIKEKNVKVQSAIQGDQVRVTGKKRDDLQLVISLLRDTKLDLPLQFENFRD